MVGEDRLLEEARSRFAAFLSSRGGRRTPERFAVLDKVYSTDEHFHADMLLEAMLLDHYPVSRSMVYDTLRLLEEAGLVRAHRFAGQATQYERSDNPQGVSHLHLVCQVCGRVRPAPEPELLSMLARRKYSTFQTSAVAVYIYGTCLRCQKRLRRAAREAEQAKAEAQKEQKK